MKFESIKEFISSSLDDNLLKMVVGGTCTNYTETTYDFSMHDDENGDLVLVKCPVDNSTKQKCDSEE